MANLFEKIKISILDSDSLEDFSNQIDVAREAVKQAFTKMGQDIDFKEMDVQIFKTFVGSYSAGVTIKK